MKYTEQAVETLDDAGSVIANKNIEIEQLRQRVAELEERRCEVCGYAEHHREHIGCLRKQVEKLTAERNDLLEANKVMADDLIDRHDRIADLTAERDAALEAAKEAQANDRCAMGYLSQVRAVVGGNDFPDMVQRATALKSALREARGTLRGVLHGNYDGSAAETITTINAALGEKK